MQRVILLFILLCLFGTPGSVFSLAPVSKNSFTTEILNGNPYLGNRVNRNKIVTGELSSIINPSLLMEITQSYIMYLDSLFERAAQRKEKEVSINIMFHDDADGLASAKIFQAFLNLYPKPSGVRIRYTMEPRSARNDSPPWGPFDSVIALDLHWALRVPGIDMAVDHHPHDDEAEENLSEKNKRLVNMRHLGIQIHQIPSRYFPAAVLTCALTDFILKVKGNLSLVEKKGEIPIEVWVNLGLVGDLVLPKDSNDCYIRMSGTQREIASRIRFLCEAGLNGLWLVAKAPSVKAILKKHEKMAPAYEDRISVLSKTFQEQTDPYLIGLFLNERDFLFQDEEGELDLNKEIVNNFCQSEVNNSRQLAEKRVVLVAFVDRDNKFRIKIRVRYDGDMNIFNLSDMRKELEALYGQKYRGGGKSDAMVFTFDPNAELDPRKAEKMEEWISEILSDFRNAIVKTRGIFQARLSDPMESLLGTSS